MRFPWKYPIEEEYTRNPELKREDVHAIQEWMKAKKYLPIVDDELISHFLHACFYNLEQTKKTIDYFYSSRNKMRNFFDDLDPNLPEIQESLKNDMIYAPFPLLDDDGNKMMVVKYKADCVNKFNYVNSSKWLMMSMLYHLWNLESKAGIVSILDCKEFSLSHLWQCSLTDVRNFSNFQKYGAPKRVVKLACINTNPSFNKLMTFLRPFMSKEILEVMSFHTDPSSFFGNMSKDKIPKDYGGSAPSIEELHWDFAKILKRNKEFLMAEANLRSDETKKGEETKQANTGFQKLFGR